MAALATAFAMLATISCSEQLPNENRRERFQERRARAAESPEAEPGRQATLLERRLSLSDEQAAEVRTILEAEGTREQQVEQIEAVLTPNQREQYETLRNRMGRRSVRTQRADRSRRGRSPVADPARRAAALQRRFELTDEQTANAEEVFGQEIPEAQQLELMREVLTPEQFSQYEARANRLGHARSSVSERTSVTRRPQTVQAREEAQTGEATQPTEATEPTQPTEAAQPTEPTQPTGESSEAPEATDSPE